MLAHQTKTCHPTDFLCMCMFFPPPAPLLVIPPSLIPWNTGHTVLWKSFRHFRCLDFYPTPSPSGRPLIGPRFTLQLDNNPKHTARVIKNFTEWQEEQGVLKQMAWPPQSPDLSITESVWDHMKRQETLRQIKSAEELWQVLWDAWNNLPAKYLGKLSPS